MGPIFGSKGYPASKKHVPEWMVAAGTIDLTCTPPSGFQPDTV